METQEHILKQCAECKHITQNIMMHLYIYMKPTLSLMIPINMTKIAAETIHNVITKLSEFD